MNSPILNLKTSMTVKKMRQCFETYDDGVRKDAQERLALLQSVDASGPKIKEIVEEASTRIADAIAELVEGMRLRNALRGQGGFR